MYPVGSVCCHIVPLVALNFRSHAMDEAWTLKIALTCPRVLIVFAGHTLRVLSSLFLVSKADGGD
jgi:hypothetical protein